MNIGPILNLYPDSLGGTLDDVVDFLKTEEAEGAFSSCYILPSLYHTDLDRGFSVIDYSLNKMYASGETLEAIKKLGIELKLDFILNHASVLSKQFQDIIAKGEESEYKDFFINWNEFWKDCGEMTEQGYILPESQCSGTYESCRSAIHAGRDHCTGTVHGLSGREKAGGYFAGNRSGAKSRKADKRTDYNDLELHGAAPVLSWSDGSEYPVAKGVGVLP